MFEGSTTKQRGAPFRTSFLTLINAYWHNRRFKLKAGKNIAATPEMIKAHKRRNSGSMRRASRVYLTKVKTMPLMRRKVATLDNRFVKIEGFKGKAFDLALSFASGLPKITIPINRTAHINRFLGNGWRIGSTIRLGIDERGVWVELIFEKERPELRTEGKVIGIDRGFRKAFVTSDGQEIGAELRDQIRRKDKRSKRAYRHIKTELFRHLKRLKLEGVKTIVLEDLRYIKHGKRGTFSRHVNRLLSF